MAEVGVDDVVGKVNLIDLVRGVLLGQVALHLVDDVLHRVAAQVEVARYLRKPQLAVQAAPLSVHLLRLGQVNVDVVILFDLHALGVVILLHSQDLSSTAESDLFHAPVYVEHVLPRVVGHVDGDERAGQARQFHVDVGLHEFGLVVHVHEHRLALHWGLLLVDFLKSQGYQGDE